jgi:hypothetical protein
MSNVRSVGLLICGPRQAREPAKMIAERLILTAGTTLLYMSALVLHITDTGNCEVERSMSARKLK